MKRLFFIITILVICLCIPAFALTGNYNMPPWSGEYDNTTLISNNIELFSDSGYAYYSIGHNYQSLELSDSSSMYSGNLYAAPFIPSATGVIDTAAIFGHGNQDTDLYMAVYGDSGNAPDMENVYGICDVPASGVPMSNNWIGCSNWDTPVNVVYNTQYWLLVYGIGHTIHTYSDYAEAGTNASDGVLYYSSNQGASWSQSYSTKQIQMQNITIKKPVSVYDAAGTFLSSGLCPEPGIMHGFTNFKYNKVETGGSVNVQARFSNDNTTWDNWANYSSGWLSLNTSTECMQWQGSFIAGGTTGILTSVNVSYVIGNVMPDAPIVSLSPIPAYNYTNLTCSALLHDNNGNNMTAYFNVSVNGIDVLDYVNETALSGDIVTMQIITDYFTTHDTISCAVMVFDGLLYSDLSSSYMDILLYTPPYSPNTSSEAQWQGILLFAWIFLIILSIFIIITGVNAHSFILTFCGFALGLYSGYALPVAVSISGNSILVRIILAGFYITLLIIGIKTNKGSEI